ncbi:ATP-binding protein [Christiangramia aquimixticola]|uniref:ATP-binding protein n=1 Tax=Christiangramia aquimixticola TaxID=1697558 RepID=UPI003AA8F0BF
MLIKSGSPKSLDLSKCEKEPIHIIGVTQPHGAVIACDKDGNITHASENTEAVLGYNAQSLLNQKISRLIGEDLWNKYKNGISEKAVLETADLILNGKPIIVVPHLSNDKLLLDFEQYDKKSSNYDIQVELTTLLKKLGSAGTINELCSEAVDITRSIFGYDRVMIYKFDEEWNGQVVAEAKKENMESFLGLNYPASDIPKQARELFYKNKVRVISDVNYKPVKLLSNTPHSPLDLTNSQLRGVSPIHIEYLQNMNVGASMTAALISNGKLWGLITCHHSQSKLVDFYQRQTCEFLVGIFSNELTLKNSENYLENIQKKEILKTELLQQVYRSDSIENGLFESALKLTDFIDCNGAALILNENIKGIGEVPDDALIKDLIADFLSKKKESVFFSNQLPQVYPDAARFENVATGILSVRLGDNNDNYLIWFRSEVVKNVSWGGNPNNKAYYNEDKKRLSPRKSFEKWTEKLRGVSNVWNDFEIKGATSLSESINYVILKNQKAEIDKLNKKLLEAHNELKLFSQGLSHDLNAPLRGVSGYAHILKEDHYVDLEQKGRMAVDSILASTEKMKDIIDNVLSFAGLSTKEMVKSCLVTNTLIMDILTQFNIAVNYPKTKIIIEDHIPSMLGDKRMLTQVWANLIANALKYSENTASPKLEIGSVIKDRKTVYYIKDNGIGFDPKYKEEIFNLFSRFSGNDYKGTGIGLALVKKILEKHEGDIWAESELGKGSTFFFYV